VDSGDPATRRSFTDILEAAQRIRFKMTLVVDLCKVAEFVALIDPSSGRNPAKNFRLLANKGKFSLRDGSQSDKMFDIPDRIIGHLTSAFGGKCTPAA
jgi:hypothetical protein